MYEMFELLHGAPYAICPELGGLASGEAGYMGTICTPPPPPTVVHQPRAGCIRLVLPHTIIKYIANYIKGRKAYTTFRNKTSTQRQFKNGVPQGGVLSPTLFNIYTSDTPTPQAPVKQTTYADDITRTSTHNDINIAKAHIQSYLHEYIHGLRQTTSSSTQTRQHAPSSHQTQQNRAHNLNYK